MGIRWSFSKLSKVEQCGLAYFRHYKMGERGPSSDALRKGSLVHETLETVARLAVAKSYSGPLDKDKVLGLYARLWATHYPDGGTAGHFRDGESIVADWVDREHSIDHSRIVAVEQRFEIDLPGGHSLMGFIDIVERSEDGEIIVKDYKTNRAIYTKEEVDESMQLGIYAMAAKTLWPGHEVLLCYDMLRHGFKQYTQRTDDQLMSLSRYIGALAAREATWEEKSHWPATLNTLCGWCSHKTMCPAYNEALDVGELEDVDPQDWQTLAEQREKLAAVEKAAKGRKQEIDTLIKIKCKEDGQLSAGGRLYKLSKTTKRTHDVGRVAELLADSIGGDQEQWIKKIATVSNDKLKKAIRGSDLDKSQQLILEAKIDGVASTRHSSMLRSSKEKNDGDG